MFYKVRVEHDKGEIGTLTDKEVPRDEGKVHLTISPWF